MNCTQFRRALSDGVTGRLDASKQAEMAAHGAACANCAGCEVEERRLLAAWQESPTSPTPDLWPRLSARLSVTTPPQPHRFHPTRQLAIAGTLCALVTAVWLSSRSGGVKTQEPLSHVQNTTGTIPTEDPSLEKMLENVDGVLPTHGMSAGSSLPTIRCGAPHFSLGKVHNMNRQTFVPTIVFLLLVSSPATKPATAQGDFGGLHRRLHLSDDQQKQIQQLYRESDRRKREIDQKLNKFNAELDNLYDRYEFDAKRVGVITEEITELRRRSLILYRDNEERLRRIISKEQFDRLREFTKVRRGERESKGKDGKHE